jgi:bifunctional non-homologous end joining protein LigD
MGDLRRYRSKRAPERTPEPFEDEAPARPLPPSVPRRFVVQQHAARRLHWDLRLEIEGVLVSFAVPRGPSLDPAEKRLAVQTEDHPLAYADFEGVIPAGNYGAGAMIVWDRGTWRAADGVDPAVGLERGKLDLWLAGEKLRGRFALVRTRRGDGDWLLIAKGRAPGGPELVEAEPASVLSGLTVEELRDGVTRDAVVTQVARAVGARRGRVDPAALRPMLATAHDAPFSREGWLFELKYDGVRVLASRDASGVRIHARAGGERTALYPEVAASLAHLPLAEFLLDGEVVVLDEEGRSSFERLQRRFTQSDAASAARLARESPAVLFVFDCLAAAGYDLRSLPLAERKRVLALFAPHRGTVRFADHVEGDGEALFEAARQHGLEGIVAKRADAPYEATRRSRHWLKIKVPRAATLAIVGVVPGRGSRARLGALLLAGRRGGAFVYAGSVGSGLAAATVSELLPALEAARRDTPPCERVPDGLPRGTWFAEPRLACEVRFTEVTEAGLLRHPVFVRLRDDVEPTACEAPGPRGGESTPADALQASRPDEPSRAGAEPPEPAPALTRLDKVFWPVEGYTKGDLLAYYEGVWPWLAPYLKDRPVVLTRYPDGIEGKHFYQKNAPSFTPDWATRTHIEGTDYFVCNDLRTLLYVINSGAIPLHVWSARLAALDRPDWLILDLDPKGAPFAHVVEIARHLHALLSELDAEHAVKTSGQDGLHILLPLGARLQHDEARALAEALARTAAAELPEIATVTRPVAARGRRVYVDYLQNGRGKLVAAPFSVRPRPAAPVSMPLTWRQVTSTLDPSRFTIRTAPALLARRGDPFELVLGRGVDVEKLLAALTARIEAGTKGRRGARKASESAARQPRRGGRGGRR